jgi:hypothetical protein
MLRQKFTTLLNNIDCKNNKQANNQDRESEHSQPPSVISGRNELHVMNFVFRGFHPVHVICVLQPVIGLLGYRQCPPQKKTDKSRDYQNA